MKPWYLEKKAIVIWSILGVLALLAVVPIGITFQLGTIKANNNLSSSASSSSGPMDMFSTKRVAIFNRSKHRLMKGVAKELAEQLQEVPYIEQVDLFSAGQRPEEGGELYDQYIVLELPELKVLGFLPVGRKMTAQVTASVGRDFWNSRRSYSDNFSPPFVRVSANLTLNHESTSWGFETASSRYALAAGNISGQLGSSIVTQLTEWTAEYQPLEGLPAAFYPAYRPVPADLPLPSEPALQCMVSGKGFMLHNYSVWSMQPEDCPAVMKTLNEDLSGQEWDVEYDASPHMSLFIRATKGGRVFEAFLPRKFGAQQNKEDKRLVIRYSDRMTGDELKPVFETMLNETQQPAEVWLSFANMLQGSLDGRLMERFLDQHGWSVAAEIHLVRYLKSKKRDDEALARLRTAYISALIDDKDQVKEIEEVGAEITGDQNWKPESPTIAELKSFGVQDLSVSEETEVEVALNKAVAFFEQREDRFRLVIVKVSPSAIPEGDFTITLENREVPGGSAFSTSSTVHGHERPWKGTISHSGMYIVAEEMADGRFLIKFEDKTR